MCLYTKVNFIVILTAYENERHELGICFEQAVSHVLHAMFLAWPLCRTFIHVTHSVFTLSPMPIVRLKCDRGVNRLHATISCNCYCSSGITQN